MLALWDQLANLEAHHASNTWPQFVLTAISGLKLLAVDTSVICETEHDQLFAEVASSINQAHIINNLRGQFFENLRAMEIPTGQWNQTHTLLLSSALCHLGYMITQHNDKIRWAKVQTARAKAKTEAVQSAANVVMGDSLSVTKSVEKLVAAEVAKLSKKLTNLHVKQQGKGHQPWV
ncbi:hypothetical protein BX666DRAFT_1882481 [Dichotomocladium elegans]|nr:hypothetical protein BX666DRAFT_1882481 [Dichotomocladium elegans]